MRALSRNLTLASCCFISLIFQPDCEAAAPKVVKAVPDNGDIDVDPTLREIKITFDQPMDKGGQSIVGGGESFPQLVGKQPGKWKDARTFVLRVRLKPNHSYWLSVNNQRFQNFRNRQGEPAVPYPISFTTGAGEGASVAPGDDNADDAEPPKVIKAVPDNGDIDVDPGLREITITFDQPMEKGGQSIVGGGESFPQLVGKQPGKWKDARTFVLRVRLRPNHSYWLSVNNQRFQNFTNRQGEPAVPYPISFTTGAAKSGADTSVEKNANNVDAVDQLKHALATQYSFRDRLDIDWPALIESKRGPLDAATDAKAFARLAATLLSKAQDKHLSLMVGEEQFPTYVRPVTPNVNVERLAELVPAWKTHSSVLASGRWEDGIGYLRIDTWDRSKTRELAPVFDILEQLKDAPALIIDVRLNGGGDERIARSVAGCFIDEPALYAKHVIVDANEPSGFDSPHERWVEPNDRRAAYRGKVAVLTGPVIMSSCEAFLLMMKQVPDAVLVGAASQGSSGNPQPVDLENGVTAFLPSWKAMSPNGTELEGVGIQPDVAVNATRRDFNAGDPVIDAALAHLRSQVAGD